MVKMKIWMFAYSNCTNYVVSDPIEGGMATL